ncbi:MAG: hypothetical protein AAF078_11340 [Planctomycetota bacterium]
MKSTLRRTAPLAALALVACPALAETTSADAKSGHGLEAETYFPFTDLGGLTVPDELSRADWQPMTVRPVDGRTVHDPTYVHPIELRNDAYPGVTEGPGELRLLNALDGAAPEHYSFHNVLDTALGWGWFAVDSASAVPRMIVQPPLQPVSTPPGATDESYGFFFEVPEPVAGGDAFDPSAMPTELVETDDAEPVEEAAAVETP